MTLHLELLPEVDWSVRIVDLGSGSILFSHNENQLLSTASIGKVFALIELAERLRDGTLALDQPLDRRRVTPVADSGLWQHLTTDVLPLTDVAALVGSVSDNWATNVLIDLLGLDAIRARAREWAPGGSDLVDVVRGLRGPDDPPHLSLGCAADLTTVLARLWADRATPDATGSRVLAWLAPGMDLSMVASAWHQDPLSHAEEYAGPILTHKTGTNLGVRADIGIIDSAANNVANGAAHSSTGADTTSRAAAYAVLANWTENPPGHRRDEVMDALHTIGRTLRAHLA
ncbi:serine hydrolase [Knoellia subterranea]|uniref:Beta-lactamase n=1 Tax=Knoellia subterranea KCTC 19937 TaxID=1385521 RepID=A0A0A0JNE9_9MICO|nr:serine hydrolase [Knoellia subterranea]KGN38294.1 beta-lactamase [Knoellia subterranea KCTC 19937]